MFNIGFTELLILAVVVLICVDPRKLPELARMIGRLFGEFKKATSDFKLSGLMGSNIENTIEKFVEKKSEEPAVLSKAPATKPETPKPEITKRDEGSNS